MADSLSPHHTAHRLIGSDKNSFAYKTIKDRLPVILTQTVDYTSRVVSLLENNANSIPQSNVNDESTEGKSLIGKLSNLRYEMMTDKPLNINNINQDGILKEWKRIYDEFAKKRNVIPSWFTVPWLFVECFMYQSIYDIFSSSQHFKDFDPFKEQKEKGFFSSLEPMQALANFLISRLESLKTGQIDYDSNLKDYQKLIQFCLWGNKTDLSLIAKYDGSQDLSSLQASSQDDLSELKSKILSDQTEDIWKFLISAKTNSERHLTFVLDNSGFELFTDLCFADWLLTSKLVTHVHFEVKSIPWFVSDVTPNDLIWTLDQLILSETVNLKTLGERWKSHFDNNLWTSASHPFWTLPNEFSTMKKVSPDLYEQLSQTFAVILKGDLNYRKLLADRNWPHETPLIDSLEGFLPTSLIALRTLKADLVSGLGPRIAEREAKENEDWMVCGKYAVIQLAEKYKSPSK